MKMLVKEIKSDVYHRFSLLSNNQPSDYEWMIGCEELEAFLLRSIDCNVYLLDENKKIIMENDNIFDNIEINQIINNIELLELIIETCDWTKINFYLIENKKCYNSCFQDGELYKNLIDSNRLNKHLFDIIDVVYKYYINYNDYEDKIKYEDLFLILKIIILTYQKMKREN